MKTNRLHKTSLNVEEIMLVLWQFLLPNIGQDVNRDIQARRLSSLEWNVLSCLAKSCWVSAFLYEEIRSAENLKYVPPAILKKLKMDCLANKLRNRIFLSELAIVLEKLNDAGVDVVLLKGAATFADNLYVHSGARAMLDLDLLVKEHKLPIAISIIQGLGYQEIVGPSDLENESLTKNRHSHISPYSKPDTPVLIEFHYNVVYGSGQKIIPTGTAWNNKQPATVEGVPCFILNPTYRIIHNTVHGLIPSRDFIKGEISFWHLLEFCYLKRRYGDHVDWNKWLRAGEIAAYRTAFEAWLLLAEDMVNSPDWPLQEKASVVAKIHASRLKRGTLLRPAFRVKVSGLKLSLRDKFHLGLNKIYYYIYLPFWGWENVCFTNDSGRVIVRIRFFLKILLDKRRWAKV